MFEIFDVQDASFLKQYEQRFMSENNKVHTEAAGMDVPLITNMPQFNISDDKFIRQVLSHYDHIYPEWVRFTGFSYIFRFEPDKPTMFPHIDIDHETCKKLEGKAKRVLIYANPTWDTQWGGGTYFAPYEQYRVDSRFMARVPRAKFAKEAALVNNVPGRAVLFDLDEIHMPQDFSGNNVQRLIFASMILHPDVAHLTDSFVGPDKSNGTAVTRLVDVQAAA